MKFIMQSVRFCFASIMICAAAITALGAFTTAGASSLEDVCKTVRPLNNDQYKFATPIRSQFGNNKSPIVRFQENATLINVTNQTRFTAANANVYDSKGNFLFSAGRLTCDGTPRGSCFSRYKYQGSVLTRTFLTRAAKKTGERRANVKFYWQVNPTTKACVAVVANRCQNVKVRAPCNKTI